MIQSIHVTAVKFSEAAASVVHTLVEFLGDANNPSALDVVAFVRYAVLRNLSTVFLCYQRGRREILSSPSHNLREAHLHPLRNQLWAKAVLAVVLLRFDDLSQDKASSNTLRAEVR